MRADRWWVEAQGRAWGPYPLARLERFLAEERLGPESRVGAAESGPFGRAADAPELAGLFAAPAPVAGPASDGFVESVGGRAEAAAESDGPVSRALLVISDAAGSRLSLLEAALATHGASVRIRPGLWLLRGASSAACVRNTLSRDLRDAMLLVVEAPLSAAAWFALEGETDRALRRLWTG